MNKIQLDMWDKLAAYNRADTEFTVFAAGSGVGKSQFQMLKEQPFFEVLDDHWEHPNRKRVDVTDDIAEWIKTQDEYSWEDTGVILWGGYHRYVITPELLTMLTLKFS